MPKPPQSRHIKIDKITKCFREFSPYSVAESLFCLDLWGPNLSSPVQCLLFTTTLASIPPRNHGTRGIQTYREFKKFLQKIIRASPGFPGLEDYFHEPEWGNVQYYFKDSRYKIFQNSDVTNAFDLLQTFEILIAPFATELQQLTTRDPNEELSSILHFQDALISSLTKQSKPEDFNNEPGKLEVPPESFWKESRAIFSKISTGSFTTLSNNTAYVAKQGSLPTSFFSSDDFLESAMNPRAFPFLFIDSAGRSLPILPKRSSAILFEHWGKIVEENAITLKKPTHPLEMSFAGPLMKFLKARFPSKGLFFFVAARSGETETHPHVFPAAIYSKNRIILFHFLPTGMSPKDAARKVEEDTPTIVEALKLIETPPPQLILLGNNQRVEFRPTDPSNTPLKATLISIAVQTTTGMTLISIPKDLPGHVEHLDSVLGVLDELETADDLSDFIDFLEDNQSSLLTPSSSLLDIYGAYVKSHGVLIDGANEPTSIMLDPSFGSAHRFHSLANFWKEFPQKPFFGNPREWKVKKDGPNRTRLMARSFRGVALTQNIGTSSGFITFPFAELDFETARIANFVCECIDDSLHLSLSTIAGHSFFSTSKDLVINVFPKSLIAKKDFAHLRHLDPGQKPYVLDSGFPDASTLSVRIVFNKDSLEKIFTDSPDRTPEVNLLEDILKEIDSRFPDRNTKGIIESIATGKTNKPRYRLFKARKPASFPDQSQPIEPEPKDFKLAKKKLATLAAKAGLKPGTFSVNASKEKLSKLRAMAIEELNGLVMRHNLAASLPTILGNLGAISHRRERERLTVNNSVSQEVDYDRAAAKSKTETDFSRQHRNARHLLEKFSHLSPDGDAPLSDDDLRYFLALIDWFFVISDAGNSLHYNITPVKLKIDDDFVIDAIYPAETQEKQRLFAEEQSAVSLGISGNPSDKLKHSLSFQTQIQRLDAVFSNDFGFKFSSLIQTLKVLTHWASYDTTIPESTSYCASPELIERIATKAAPNLTKEELPLILEFLTLDRSKILSVTNEAEPCDDIPVWEHNKRPYRYAIKPLISLGGSFFWEPYGTENAGIIWSGSPSTGKLPITIEKPKISSLTRDWKSQLDDLLVLKSEEIFRRHTKHVEREVYLHKRDRANKHPLELGDYDILSFFPSANTIIHAECKNLSQPFCLKDARRLRDTIFGKNDESRGHFEKITPRHEYLFNNVDLIGEIFRWPLKKKEKTQIISLYITPITFWWTRYPEEDVVSRFVRLEQLSSFLSEFSS